MNEHGERRRVLVVDDNTDAAELVAAILALDGHTTAVAGGGAAGIALAAQFHPEVVFLDIGMPGVDGYQVAAALRQRWGAHIRLVALTAWNDAKSVARMYEAGFNAHLTKPATVERLTAALRATP